MTREELLAAVNEEVDDALKEGFAPSIGDEAFSASIVDELLEAGVTIPESTRIILFGLLVIFEMRQREQIAKSVLQ